MNELVSIIIPTYKRADMLPRAIDSILNGTYKNIEIVVIDDNNPDSTDRIKTKKVMEKYKKNKCVKYYEMEKNEGGCASRNYGIEKANGKIIAFLDDDDEYLPNKIEVQLKHFIENELDASFSACNVYDHNNKLIKIKRYDNFDEYGNKFVFHLVEMITGTQTFMFTKEILNKVNGFEKVPAGQEYYLMYKVLLAGAKIGYVDIPLTNIYIHDNERITTGKKKIPAEKFLLTLKRKHYNLLTYEQKKYVEYRYKYNVAAYYKDNNKIKYLLWGIYIFISHPIIFIRKVLKK